jgi:hypothetical protein
MRKLLFAAVLSLAGVGLGAGQASAWSLHCHHCCKNCASICVRPYNAFSPSIFGSLCVDGCFPLSCANHGACGPQGCGQPPWYGGGFGCAGDGCGAPGYGAAAALINPPARGTPTVLPGGVPTFQGPSPVQVPAGAQLGVPGVQPTVYGPAPWMQPPGYGANPAGR